MEQQGNGQTPGMGAAGSSSQMPNSMNPCEGNQMTGLSSPASAAGLSASPAQMAQHQLDQQQQRLLQKLQNFWASQSEEIEKMTDFENHSLPLARIKEIMKADENVGMIPADTSIAMAQACGIFIQELTLRAWHYTEENNRMTLQKDDIAAAIAGTGIFDFLANMVVPREDFVGEPVDPARNGEQLRPHMDQQIWPQQPPPPADS